MLVGREPERARLERSSSRPDTGPPAVWSCAASRASASRPCSTRVLADARDATVLRTQGLEVEAPLAFAALHRLLRPVLRLRADLPAPQARALGVAFGEDDGPGVEPFLVAVATLSLLTAAAEEDLVLCVVDDAHWLDPASAEALLFCARRLGADRAAHRVRDSRGQPRDVRPARTSRDRPDRSRPGRGPALLEEHLGGEPADEVAERLIVETRGNPLALLELPGELSPDQLRGSRRAARPSCTSPPASSSPSSTGAVDCPTPVQSLLLLAAADDTGDRAVAQAGSGLAGRRREQALEAAVESGLLSADGEPVQVRHPLVRSAVYQAATARNGAGSTGPWPTPSPARDPDREAWHRAAAAEGPDRGRRRGPGGRRVTCAAPRRLCLGAVGVRARSRADPRHRETGRPDRCGGPQRLGVRPGHPGPGPAGGRSPGHAWTRCCSATSPGSGDISRSTSARPPTPTGSSSRPRTRSTSSTQSAPWRSPYRRRGDADLRRGQRHRLPAVDIVAARPPSDSPRTACLKQLLDRDDLGGRRGLGAGRRGAGPRAARGEDVDDRDVLGNLGNAALQLGDDDAQRRFYSLALSRAREAGP